MMKNPFGPQNDPGLYAYANLHKRMLKHVQDARINDQIFNVVQKTFEKALIRRKYRALRPRKKAHAGPDHEACTQRYALEIGRHFQILIGLHRPANFTLL